jgi:NAD(P)-dependent dehydrogenase (short-subunit alcohol dehydrogenase family)
MARVHQLPGVASTIMTTGSIASVLAGRTALVTGATSGLGVALTRRLVDGAAVLAVDRDDALTNPASMASMRTPALEQPS